MSDDQDIDRAKLILARSIAREETKRFFEFESNQQRYCIIVGSAQTARDMSDAWHGIRKPPVLGRVEGANGQPILSLRRAQSSRGEGVKP